MYIVRHPLPGLKLGSPRPQSKSDELDCSAMGPDYLVIQLSIIQIQSVEILIKSCSVENEVMFKKNIHQSTYLKLEEEKCHTSLKAFSNLIDAMNTGKVYHCLF